MVGLRFYTNERHPQSWFTDGTLDWLCFVAERAQVPVALGAAMFLPTVGKIAERHPDLKLIVDHMGVPRASKGEAAYRFQSELLLWPNTRMWRSQWICKLYRMIRKSAGDSLFQHFTEFYPV